jgi:hypothetical protein
MFPVLTELFDRNGIDEAELLRLTYRMAGEVWEEEEDKAPTMLKKPLKQTGGGNQPAPGADPNAPDPNAQPDPQPQQ